MKYKGIPIDDISIFTTPLVYLQLVFALLIDLVSWVKKLLLKRGLAMIGFVALWMLVTNLEALQTIQDICYFSLYWVILGVASSIGLGTGLHTFVLYLGPHIAKVTIAATHCGYMPDMIPSRWTFDHFADCSSQPNTTISALNILIAVQIQSFLWGLGTALGELPPYFVSKKASETRAELKRMADAAEGHPHTINSKEKKLIEAEKKEHHLSSEQIEEVLELKRKPNLTLMERAKIFIYDNMEKYGFLTILISASIPNPLFDLAGITCGHFRIPFRTFFTATFIGKAIIKVHIQMLFVIAIFRKQSLDAIINFVKWFSEDLAVKAATSLQEQKKVLYEPSRFSENKPLIAKLWDVFLILMIAYFLKSILDSSVKEKAIALTSDKAKSSE